MSNTMTHAEPGRAATASSGATLQTTDIAAAPKEPQKQDAHGGHDGGGGHDALPTNLKSPGPVALVVAILLLAGVLAALFFIGYVPHEKAEATAKQDAKDTKDAVVTVRTAFPKQSTPTKDINMPCDVRAFQDTSIFTRADGFIKKWYVDIGDHVEAGQLLAEIDTPDVDAQLNQSRATLDVSRANVTRSEADLNLAQRTLDRYQALTKNGNNTVTQQEVDEKVAARDQAAATLLQTKATVQSSEAAVQRLTVLQGFERIIAPFSGTITARNYDVGARVSPSNTTPGQEVYRMQETDMLRVFVQVPQVYATGIKVGQKVNLKVRNYNDRPFEGVVARKSDNVNLQTRQMAFELHFPNKDGSLYPGMYGQVSIGVTDPNSTLMIPSSALVFDANGTSVQTVKDGKIHVQHFTPGRDLGTELEVRSGLTTDDRIVTAPGEALTEGEPVQLHKDDAPKTAVADSNPNAAAPKPTSERLAKE